MFIVSDCTIRGIPAILLGWFCNIALFLIVYAFTRPFIIKDRKKKYNYTFLKKLFFAVNVRCPKWFVVVYRIYLIYHLIELPSFLVLCLMWDKNEIFVLLSSIIGIISLFATIIMCFLAKAVYSKYL